ncbi:efflux RND transporter permease subunit [Pseudodonghicola flavimaris]|uniref:Efflux RND transporter permease subunit n=1 Tax=Pseudodonghicola flavimaris TaxID=3050036 RepID=A0ABT7EXN4_9RHOB|nr:efflux RND transporter permease subunit [Pseudodonghicola flavimaris]MDK3017093.1 efflux RND transporter permease subunit [Pseudodonghicola flavimaris]
MIRFFVRHPVASNLMMILICVLGIAVVANIERETFPEFAASSVAVTVPYPGASARDVDEEICIPLEDALTGTAGLAEFDCLSMDGRGLATAEMQDGGDIIQFFNDVDSAVSGITDFPADAETPSVELQGRTDLVALIAVSGIPGKEGLIDYSDRLSDRLQLIDGVAEAQVGGISDREIRVSFDPGALRRFGLSGSDVLNAIEARSLRQPLGTVEVQDTSYVLRYADVRRSVSELGDLIILQNSAGGVVRLQDLATIEMVDSDENVQSFIDGDQAAIITILKSSDDDSIRVFSAVDEVLQAERASYPAPFRLTVINNLTDVVKERLDLIVQNIGMGLVLVFGTMALFFSLRESLWISASLPVSFLGGLFLMNMFGITINMITLVALLMAVGVIMDDSIVIAENIDKWRRRAGPLEAATRGTAEVLPGVLSSFLTTACVFGPLMFISGDFGKILKFIPMVLLLVLTLSLIEGFLILPNHLSHGGRGGRHDPQARRAARVLERFKARVLLPAAAALVRVRYLTFGVVIAALMLSVGLVASGKVKVIGFPSTESDTVVARVALTPGIDRSRTVETVDQLVAALNRVNARLSPGTEGGAPLIERVLVQYAVNSDVDANGSNTATVTADLLGSDRRNVAAEEVLALWRQETGPIPDLVQGSFAQSERGPGGSDLDVELSGHDLETLEAAANALLVELVARPDVTEAFVDLHGGRQEVQLALTPFGYSVGLTPQNLAAQLRNAFAGAEADSFRAGPSSMTVQVELGDTIASLAEFEMFPVTLPDGKQVGLDRVASITQSTSYPTITRKDGLLVARLEGQIDRAATTSGLISAVVTEELAPRVLAAYPGVEIGIGGATLEQQKSQASMGRALLLGLVGVYLVLAFQFRSYSLPILVMISIPFALIGTILGHAVLGLDLSMPSMIGFASLSGIVVNNAILFLTFFQDHLEGEDYVTASLNAVNDRFRPILLSSSTTFVGLLPIMFDTSPQVQPLVPLVASVAFGLLASMVLVVLVLPSILSIYFDIFSLKKWMAKFDDGEEAPEEATAKPV